MVGAVAPFALPALVAIMAAFYWLYAYFQAAQRQVKRLDAVSRSPVLSSLGEALAGTDTLRVYGRIGHAARQHAGEPRHSTSAVLMGPPVITAT